MAKSKIPGGLAEQEGVTAEDVDPAQLKMGIEVELEHTDDRAKAEEIALDHLAEIPDYYTRLKQMEDEAEKSEPQSVEKAMNDGKPGESLKETSTEELVSTYKKLDEGPMDDEGERARHDAIRAELKARDALPEGERGESEAEEREEHAEKSGIDELGEYLEKAGQKLPTRNPKDKDVTTHTDADGDDELEGKGKTSGSVNSGEKAKLVPAGKTHSLKTGDAKADDISKRTHQDGGMNLERSMTPAAQREMIAHEHAVHVSKLRKGEGSVVVGEVEQYAMPEQQGRHASRSPYSVEEFAGNIDAMAADLAKGEGFYHGPEPEAYRPTPVLQKSITCDLCKSVHAAMLTSCPECGGHQVGHQLAPDGELLGEHRLAKSNFDPAIRKPASDPDLYIPGPSEIPVKR
jgi:hypothetical protein